MSRNVVLLYYNYYDLFGMCFHFAERPGTAASVRSVTSVSGGGVDVVRGGYLGRFVNDKTGNPHDKK